VQDNSVGRPVGPGWHRPDEIIFGAAVLVHPADLARTGVRAKAGSLDVQKRDHVRTLRTEQPQVMTEVTRWRASAGSMSLSPPRRPGRETLPDRARIRCRDSPVGRRTPSALFAASPGRMHAGSVGRVLERLSYAVCTWFIGRITRHAWHPSGRATQCLFRMPD
jgi:hypothetical protein